MNSFLFVRFSQVQKLLSSVSTGLKNTPSTVGFCPEKTRHNGLANSLLLFTRGGRFCCFSLRFTF